MQRMLGEVLRAKPPVLYTVPPDMAVADAVQIMREVNIGAVLVVAGDRLRGIFTERDLLRRVVAEHRDPHGTPVERVMTPDPLCVDETTTVQDAMLMVTDQRIRHLPVSRAGRLAGIVSSRDLMDWILRAQARDIAALREAARGAVDGITVESG